MDPKLMNQLKEIEQEILTLTRLVYEQRSDSYYGPCGTNGESSESLRSSGIRLNYLKDEKSCGTINDRADIKDNYSSMNYRCQVNGCIEEFRNSYTLRSHMEHVHHRIYNFDHWNKLMEESFQLILREIPTRTRDLRKARYPKLEEFEQYLLTKEQVIDDSVEEHEEEYSYLMDQHSVQKRCQNVGQMDSSGITCANCNLRREALRIVNESSVEEVKNDMDHRISDTENERHQKQHIAQMKRIRWDIKDVLQLKLICDEIERINVNKRDSCGYAYDNHRIDKTTDIFNGFNRRIDSGDKNTNINKILYTWDLKSGNNDEWLPSLYMSTKKSLSQVIKDKLTIVDEIRFDETIKAEKGNQFRTNYGNQISVSKTIYTIHQIGKDGFIKIPNKDKKKNKILYKRTLSDKRNDLIIGDPDETIEDLLLRGIHLREHSMENMQITDWINNKLQILPHKQRKHFMNNKCLLNPHFQINDIKRWGEEVRIFQEVKYRYLTNQNSLLLQSKSKLLKCLNTKKQLEEDEDILITRDKIRKIDKYLNYRSGICDKLQKGCVVAIDVESVKHKETNTDVAKTVVVVTEIAKDRTKLIVVLFKATFYRDPGIYCITKRNNTKRSETIAEEEILEKLNELLNDKMVIFYNVESDIKAVGIKTPKNHIDLQWIFKREDKTSISLRKLVLIIFNKDIQSEVHDPVIDAKNHLKLFKLVKRSIGRMFNTGERINLHKENHLQTRSLINCRDKQSEILKQCRTDILLKRTMEDGHHDEMMDKLSSIEEVRICGRSESHFEECDIEKIRDSKEDKQRSTRTKGRKLICFMCLTPGHCAYECPMNTKEGIHKINATNIKPSQ